MTDYIQGTTNTNADLLSRHQSYVGLEKERNGDISIDINTTNS